MFKQSYGPATTSQTHSTLSLPLLVNDNSVLLALSQTPWSLSPFHHTLIQILWVLLSKQIWNLIISPLPTIVKVAVSCLDYYICICVLSLVPI